MWRCHTLRHKTIYVLCKWIFMERFSPVVVIFWEFDFLFLFLIYGKKYWEKIVLCFWKYFIARKWEQKSTILFILIWKFSSCSAYWRCSLFFPACWFPDAYDPLDPNGNITIKWDIISWTPDGYVVSSIWFLS